MTHEDRTSEDLLLQSWMQAEENTVKACNARRAAETNLRMALNFAKTLEGKYNTQSRRMVLYALAAFWIGSMFGAVVVAVLQA